MSRGAVVYLVICLPSSLLKLNLSGCRQNLLDEGQSYFTLYYRPQRSCEGYVFTPVGLSTRGGSASVYAGIPPPRTRHPPGPDGYCCGWYASYWNAFLLFMRRLLQLTFVTAPYSHTGCVWYRDWDRNQNKGGGGTLGVGPWPCSGGTWKVRHRAIQPIRPCLGQSPCPTPKDSQWD